MKQQSTVAELRCRNLWQAKSGLLAGTVVLLKQEEAWILPGRVGYWIESCQLASSVASSSE